MREEESGSWKDCEIERKKEERNETQREGERFMSNVMLCSLLHSSPCPSSGLRVTVEITL